MNNDPDLYAASLSWRKGHMLLAVLFALCMVPSAHAAFRFVTNNKDSGAGSLRQAITDANAALGADTIVFGIPGDGVHVIRTVTLLPTITDSVLIAGYTQAGAMPNTLEEGDNAQIRIRLDGTGTSNVPGLGICASTVIIEGLSITNFDREGISVGRKSDNSSCPTIGYTGIEINGNFIGLAPDGVSAGPQGFSGVQVAQSAARIGNGSAANRNIISSNLGHGILLGAGAADTRIDGNYIGTDASGELDRGNAGGGIRLFSAGSGNVVNENAPNRIAYNQNGIEVVASVGVVIGDNEIFVNDSLGIDLVATGGTTPDGVTNNDIDDVDTGANNLQNFPLLTSVTRTATGISVSGSLDRPAGAGSLSYAIRLYGNDSCDTSGHGEGRRFLGQRVISITNAVETFTFNLSTATPLSVGNVISATASDTVGNTSEFSTCVPVDGGPETFVVVNTNDSGTGSLRQAMLDANSNPGGDLISFNIAGSGVKIISPITNLPTLTDTVSIDAYTQPGSSVNTLAVGDNANLRVQLDGTGAGTSAIGLVVCANDVLIRGLSVTRFASIGILFDGAPAGDPCESVHHAVRIAGNFVGLAPDGSAPGGQLVGVENQLMGGAQIGGIAVSDRNVISGNGSITSAFGRQIGLINSPVIGTVITNNYIGTDPSGTQTRNSPGDGIVLSLNADGVTVGGARGNLIAFVRNGILVTATANSNDIRGNDIHSNAGLGIDLVALSTTPDGVTPNDVDDTDNGGNFLQNFPQVTSVRLEYGQVRLVGTLDVPTSVSNAIFRIDAFANSACDANGFGEGRTFVTSRNVKISNSEETLDVDVAPAQPLGSIMTFTATGFSGSTSEFSQCATLVAGDGIFTDAFDN